MLVEFLDYQALDDTQAGEVLLTFLDEDGCRVSVRMRRSLVTDLTKRFAYPPDLLPPI